MTSRGLVARWKLSAFILFTLAVMVCLRFGGVLSGAIATVLSIFAGMIVFLGPARDKAETLADAVEVVLFACVDLGIVWLAQQLPAAKLRAEDALEQERTLTGLLPIYAWCKKIRNRSKRTTSFRNREPRLTPAVTFTHRGHVARPRVLTSSTCFQVGSWRFDGAIFGGDHLILAPRH